MSPWPSRGGWDRAAHARLEGWVALAERGWRLFPIRPGSKVPAISQWSQRATSDPDRLSRFFRAHPTHNAGIACGPSGLVVVDCDVAKPDQPLTRWRDGAAVFDDLAALHGGTPDTWTVATPSGGQHRYYSAPTDRVLGNTSRVLGPLVDTRGDGGQVLAPGSVLPAGGYELLDDTDPAPLPGWLTTRLTPPPPTTPAPVAGVAAGRALSSRHAAYVASAVAAETERVRHAGRGGHNTAVFTAANALGQLVGAGALARAEAEATLTAAAEHICAGPCDCTQREVAASIRSGLDRGTRNPRNLPAGPRTDTRSDARSDAAGGDTVTPRDDTPSISEVAALTARLRTLSSAGRDADPAERAAFVTDKDAEREFDELTERRPLPGEGSGSWVSDGRGSYLWVDEDAFADEAESLTVGEELHADPRVIAAEVTGLDASTADVPGDVARWAPAGEAEQTLTAREAARRLGEEGFTEAEAAAAVTAYFDDIRRDTGAVAHWWGLDSHDLAAITRAERASQDVAATLEDAGAATGFALMPGAIPAPRLDAEEARRDELNRWHAADSAEAGTVDGLDDSAVRS